MSFSFRVAWRFLKSDKKQTLLIILGIAIGISVQIFVGLLIDSLQISLVNSTVGNSAHITIDSNETYGEVENYQEISSEVVKVDGVKFVVPSIDRVSNIQNFSDTGKQIIVKGWDLDQANDIYNLYNDKFTGAKPTKINETLIGTKLAEDFDISPGELLNFSMPNNYDYYTMKVVGIFDLGVASLNENWVITNNETIYAIYKPGNNATSINIQVEDVFQADIIAQTIREEVDIDQDNVEIVDWKEQNASLLSGLQGQTISSVFIQAFVLISVIIAIASILAITVLQKSRQVGILKAMGTDNVKASRIFLYEGLLLGIGGTILGITIGVGLLGAFGTFAKNEDGTPVVAITFDWAFIGISAAISIISSLFAGLIPARKSKKLSIIDIIREG